MCALKLRLEDRQSASKDHLACSFSGQREGNAAIWLQRREATCGTGKQKFAQKTSQGVE